MRAAVFVVLVVLRNLVGAAGTAAIGVGAVWLWLRRSFDYVPAFLWTWLALAVVAGLGAAAFGIQTALAVRRNREAIRAEVEAGALCRVKTHGHDVYFWKDDVGSVHSRVPPDTSQERQRLLVFWAQVQLTREQLRDGRELWFPQWREEALQDTQVE